MLFLLEFHIRKCVYHFELSFVADSFKTKLEKNKLEISMNILLLSHIIKQSVKVIKLIQLHYTHCSISIDKLVLPLTDKVNYNFIKIFNSNIYLFSKFIHLFIYLLTFKLSLYLLLNVYFVYCIMFIVCYSSGLHI